MGNNGVLTQAKNAVEVNREAAAIEDVQMAWASAKAQYYEDWATNSATDLSTYFTKAKLDPYLVGKGAIETIAKGTDGVYTVGYRAVDQNKLYTFLVTEDGTVTKKSGVVLSDKTLTLEKDETATLTAELIDIEGTVTWTSSTPGVATVSNTGVVTAVANGTATITATCGTSSDTCRVTVSEPITSVTFSGTLPTQVDVGGYVDIAIASVGPTGATGDLTWACDSAKVTVTPSTDTRSAIIAGVTKTEGTEKVTITIKNAKGTAVTNGTIELEVKAPEILAMTAQIGDYVDIGLNCSSYTGKWRVLSKSGNTANDTVTLISAGAPIQYYMYQDAASAITALSNMNSITITSGTGNTNQGFRSNGITTATSGTVDLNAYFSTDDTNSSTDYCYRVYDSSAGIHAFGCNTKYDESVSGTNTELETLYTYMTGYTTRNMKALNGIGNALSDFNLQTAAATEATGKSVVTWQSRWNGLLTTGSAYWLGGAPFDSQDLWLVRSGGGVGLSSSSTFGLRLVVSLQSGVKITGGTGADASHAYTLTK